MMLPKFISNKGKEGVGPCESILGSLDGVNAFAEFWQAHPDLVQLAGIASLLDYAEANEFTAAEYAAFKIGLGSMGAFMQECWEERDEYVKANQKLSGASE